MCYGKKFTNKVRMMFSAKAFVLLLLADYLLRVAYLFH